MHTNERLIARVKLRLRIYESDGSAFETLFTTVMDYAHDDFVQIKPQGTYGDRKNDGYHPETGHYYQVYAPENPADDKARGKAATKAADDFQGLRDFWHDKYPVKGYSFVFKTSSRAVFQRLKLHWRVSRSPMI